MRRSVAISLTSALGAMLLPALAASAATTGIEVREATNVRSIYTSEFGEARPAALTYSPDEEALFTADDTVDGTMNLVGVTTVEDPAGEVTATIQETTTTADTLVSIRSRASSPPCPGTSWSRSRRPASSNVGT